MNTITLSELTNKVSLLNALVIKQLEDGQLEEAKETSQEVENLIWHFARLAKSMQKEEIL